MMFTFTHEDQMDAALAELKRHGFSTPDTPGVVQRYLLRVTDAYTPERHRLAKHLGAAAGGTYEHGGPPYDRRSATVPVRS